MKIKDKIKLTINAIRNTENKKIAIEKAYKEYKHGGMRALKDKILTKAYQNEGIQYVSNTRYDINMEIFNNQQNELSRDEMVRRINDFKNKPLISIVMPVYNVPIKWLDKAVESLKNQVYQNWELCAVDDCSTNIEVIEALKKYEKNDLRIKVHYSEKNGGISTASNISVSMANGEYLALMDNDDEITNDALFWIANEINEYPEVDFIYSDECICDDTEESKKIEFQFKPDWSPESLMGFMYTGHLTVYKKELINLVGGFRSKHDFGQDYDMALRISEKAKCIRHIERVLYIWRAIDGSIAKGGKLSSINIGANISREAMERRGFNVITLLKPYGTYHRLIQDKEDKVSIIINVENIEISTRTIETITHNTAYSNYEIIIVSSKNLLDELKIKYSYLNNIKYCECDDKINYSKRYNKGSKISEGKYLIFYKDTLVINNAIWINQLIESLQLNNVGGVSPKIIKLDDTIKYSGMISGTFGLVADPFEGVYKEHYDEHWTRHKWTRNISILSASCTAIKKDLFDKLGGFDEKNTPNRLSNVDLSYKIIDSGKTCVYIPNIEMKCLASDEKDSWMDYFGEGASSDAYILKKWNKYIGNDPYYTESMKKSTISHIPLEYKIYNSDEKIYTDISKTILLVSHELSMTGAPVVLYEVAKVLKDEGFFPVIVSPMDGKLREEIHSNNITVIIDPSIGHHEYFKRFAESFDLIISNTLVTRNVIEQMNNSKVPIMWWIHEGKVSFDILKNHLPNKISDNVKVYVVGEYVKNIMSKYMKDVNSRTLPYGIPDCAKNYIATYNNEKIIFTIIGTIDYRKAQNIFIDAIYELPEHYRKRAKFIIIGKNYTAGLREKINKAINELEEIEYIEELSRERMMDIHKYSDIIVSTSVDDPMPVVLTEGMMFSKVCICTRSTGTSKLITDTVDGFVIDTNDYKSLAEIMMNIIDNPKTIKDIGRKSRKIYEDNFTTVKLKSNLIKEINKII